MTEISPTLIGSRLLQLGFRPWVLYMFRVVNGTPFVVEKMHEEIFKEFDRIIAGEDTRVCMNLCPRSGKTTLAIWLCVYALLINPRSQIIYTSFSQELLKTVSGNIQTIMTHPVFTAMYPTTGKHQVEDREEEAVDVFWRDYAQQENNKPTFSSRKITTAQGGVLLFNSIGAAITGFGVSVRNAKGFSGILILDDADKPGAPIRSEVIRTKTHVYFSETLLSRLNNPTAPILNMQQRLHLDDMSGFLLDRYNFKHFVFPLLNEDGTCNLPTQYTPERIKELQIDHYAFSAQYQQQPQRLGGGVFKREWWRYYADINDTRYRRIFITADTASKTRDWNDYSAIGVWGLTTNNRLRLLDLVHARLEFNDLIATFQTLWAKWRDGLNGCRCNAIYIEDKASGIQAIQDLRRKGGLPIMPVVPKTDKLTRALEWVPQVAAGNVELPVSDAHPLSAEFLKDLDAFSADGSHKFDDEVDCLLYALDAAYNSRGYF